MALWIVLSVGAVMSIMFFTFNLMVRQRNAQAHAVYFGEVAQGLAESGLDLTVRELRRQLEARDGLLFRALVETPSADLVGEELPVTLEAEREQLLEATGADATLDLEVTAVAAADLVPDRDPSQGWDPFEKELTLEFRSSASFRGAHRAVLERRRARVQLDLLPVLSRFTLWVSQPETDTPLTPGYNLYANDINGVIDTVTTPRQKNYLPLVLYNHGEVFPRLEHDVEANGWVYLGGRDPITLNLTAGADYRYGQYFHFYNFLTDGSKQPAFLSESPPEFFTRTYREGGQEREYMIKHVIYGYFTVDRGDPPGDMNRDDVLEQHFRAGGNMRSSVLHLHGSSLAPSPTRVFGEVYQGYAIYSGVTVDVDGDGRRDGVLGLLPSVDASGYEELRMDPGFGSSTRDLRGRGQLSLDPRLLTMDRMFGSYDDYSSYMSALIDGDAYNSSIDYMRSQGRFPLEERVLDEDEDYPNLGREVAIRRRGESGSEGLHFQGDLGSFDPEVLERRCLLRVADQQEFEQLFLDGRTLRLGCAVRIEEGKLRLPDRLQVERGGMILAEGNITFDGVSCEPGERLSLVSRRGHVTSEFSHASEQRPAEVDLVALGGRVACTDRNHQLAIQGTLAARRLYPVDFQGGGRVVYDPRGDPAGPDRGDVARVYLADRAESWRM